MNITSYFSKDLFQGKTVFITGGSSGINLGIARNFAAVGANLGICGRAQDKLDAASAELRELGARVSAHSADVRDYAALDRAMQRLKEELGPIHTLVCGAAGNFPCPAEQISPNGFKSVIDIDLMGTFHACRAAFEQLKETGGNILFISAGQAFMPYAFQAHVGAAKAGIDQMMRNLALEWGRFGIRCNSIAPGPIEGTEGVRRLVPEGSADKLKKMIPLGRFGTPDDIGQLSVFLASPLASYITGTLVVADGGQNLPGSGAWTHLIMAEMAKAKG
ncbi:SDR family oxidoreductase [Candidatus Contendibacter odensensis]|uniref:Short-chain dehydrogenase/reductase SDR n=1 Tax=Candidatus Contendobacter odensis Run_B_J11 TaxID=1400861 RepID=A0A7U7G9Q5_9GAMM|nr:SDR family oxidoreductase [Candidatus Contendobacter odensis]CDH44508.1 Short-chain dehydrogenase/reductase SDR [Candidatus Contendobacter odensis Run_B_J11]